MSSDRSRRLFEEARTLLPGGVSSPVRAFAPYPRYISKGKGSRIWDVDGNEYIDYCLGFGPLILGHAHPRVVAAVQEQVEMGTLYGAPVEDEIRMARTIQRHFPSMEMLRLVSTGTEATMHALRLARGYTGRRKVIKVEGGFHGAHDSMLVKAGSGALTHSAPDSLGVPEEVAGQTLLVPYNDPAAVERACASNRGEVAAMIVEPVLGNIGPVTPAPGYLQELREITHRHGVVLIFDEVITGFRLSMGGAQGLFDVEPDLTVLGKVAGGGLPLAAFGGRGDIMAMLSPSGGVYHAGTFSGNPLSLSAGLAALGELEKQGHQELDRRGALMQERLSKAAEESGTACTVQGIGSMFQMFLTPRPVRNYTDALSSDAKRFMAVFRTLLDQGIYLPPSQFETCFLSTAHTDNDVQRTADAWAEALMEARA